MREEGVIENTPRTDFSCTKSLPAEAGDFGIAVRPLRRLLDANVSRHFGRMRGILLSGYLG